MNTAVLVPSYDKFSDLWPIASTCFERFWPDRTIPMYWMTNGAPVPANTIPVQVPAGERRDWGLGIIRALEQIPADKILFWIEEVLLLSPVNNALVEEAARWLDDSRVSVVNLTRYYYGEQYRMTHGSFAEVPNKRFAVMAMPAMFDKFVLIDLLRINPDPPEFERMTAGTFRARYPDQRALVPCEKHFRFCDNLLVFGLWRKCALNHLQELGIAVDPRVRGIYDGDCEYMNGTDK